MPIHVSVANGLNVRPHNSKGAEYKSTNQRPNWGSIFTERAEKGPNFETALLPLLFSYG